MQNNKKKKNRTKYLNFELLEYFVGDQKLQRLQRILMFDLIFKSS